MPDQSSLRPLAEPLAIAATELGDLARLADQLQHVLGRVALGFDAPDAQFVTDAQTADLLSQRLEGMAAFLRALSEAVPTDAVVDVEAAVAGLTLAEQARRLRGPHATADEAPASGDLFMFEV